MKRVLHEPLLHFLILGAMIFGAYNGLSKHTNEPGKIVVSQGQVESMLVGFARTWQRPPSSEDLDRLIQDRVREEVYYREAKALGLDNDDTVIRRRLRQKMEFISDDASAQIQPTDDELTTYLLSHPDSFRIEQQFTFSHIYLNPEKHGDNLLRDAAQLLSELNLTGGNADTAELGDPLLIAHTFSAEPGSEIAKQFGDKFRAALSGLPSGNWQGPIESGYGLHLVFINTQTAGRDPTLAEVREAVNREWLNARRVEANEKFYNELLSRYVVTIERPEPEKTKVAANEVK